MIQVFKTFKDKGYKNVAVGLKVTFSHDPQVIHLQKSVGEHGKLLFGTENAYGEVWNR